jgi:apolipoprotein N-acyltransferase
LGYLGFGVWPLLGLFLIPLWWALEGAEGFGEAALLGLMFGGVAYIGGFPWLWRLVEIFLAGDEGLGAVLWMVHGLWFATGFAVVALLARVIRGRGWPFALAGVAPLLIVEWLHPQIFPVYAGAGLAGVTPLVQIVDLGGPLLLTALVGVINAAGFETLAWLHGMRRLPLTTILGALALVLAALAYGQLREADLDERLIESPVLRVGIVQANLGVLDKGADARGAHRAHLEASRALLESGPLDLVVWPESAVPRALRGPLPLSGSPIRRDLEVPLLFGGTLIEVADGRRTQANASLLVGADGMIEEAYRKNLLIPLAESVPLGRLLPGLESRLPHAHYPGQRRLVRRFPGTVAPPAARTPAGGRATSLPGPGHEQWHQRDRRPLGTDRRPHLAPHP